ncbi:PadR family transcriptional regulator [Nonomuraea dietziae]|uniref:PadR family transcriptional regulator n=1 Tax=Nonomuraea dietziae TaxID=65515 RepID=UPI0031DBAD21
MMPARRPRIPLRCAATRQYDLRRRIAALTAPRAGPSPDGTLYPLLKRMETAGLLRRELQPVRSRRHRHHAVR